MNVNLTQEMEELIHQKVESGLYNSPSEVVEEALHLLAQHDQLRQRRIEEIRGEIALGLKDLDEGRKAPLDERMFEEIIAAGRARLEAHKQDLDSGNAH